MLFVMLFTSKGAAGVAGAGFVALAATMPALGTLPVGGLAMATPRTSLWKSRFWRPRRSAELRAPSAGAWRPR